jgi:hypothetical protein
VSKKRLLRKIFGPKRDEVTGEWRRLHKEEVYVNKTKFPNVHAQFSFSLLYAFRPNKRPSSGGVQC